MAASAASAEILFYPKTCQAQFACPSCRHTEPVVFHDPDAFAEDEPIGGRSPAFRAAALEQAQKTLTAKALKALPLVPCPKCGALAPAALQKAYLRAALPLLAVVPVVLPTLTMLFGVITPATRITSALIALAVTTLLSLAITVWGQRKLVGDARRSVQFRS